eukprot:4919689-Heterocapsa_arctica.AAC.2
MEIATSFKFCLSTISASCAASRTGGGRTGGTTSTLTSWAPPSLGMPPPGRQQDWRAYSDEGCVADRGPSRRWA